MKTFTQDFKKETVRKDWHSDLTRKAFAKEIGIHPDTLRKWINTYKDEVEETAIIESEKFGKVYPEFRIEVNKPGTEQATGYINSWKKLTLCSDKESAHVWKFLNTAKKYAKLAKEKYGENSFIAFV